MEVKVKKQQTQDTPLTAVSDACPDVDGWEAVGCLGASWTWKIQQEDILRLSKTLLPISHSESLHFVFSNGITKHVDNNEHDRF